MQKETNNNKIPPKQEKLGRNFVWFVVSNCECTHRSKRYLFLLSLGLVVVWIWLGNRRPQVVHVTRPVNCRALIEGDPAEQEHAERIMTSLQQTPLTGEDYVHMTGNCSRYKSNRGYSTRPLSPIEENFSIAFSIVMYRDIEQVELLLKAIYQPQNVYCIHVDRKCSYSIKIGMEAIARCFDNVFVIQDPVDVQWATFSVLEAELLCMRELWKYKKWKYFINLTGQEFPLKTNYELVQILKAFNGANNVEAVTYPFFIFRLMSAGPPPHNITPMKGAVHATLSRPSVDFILHNRTAQDLLVWVNKTLFPDEIYFSTLNHNPQLGVPGAYKGIPESHPITYPFLTRYKRWRHWLFDATCLLPYQDCLPACHGKYVRYVCIFSVKDLPILTSQPHLFANKFHLDYEPLALQCLEEWHANKTRDEQLNNTVFDISFYKDLPFTKNKVQ